MVNEQISESLLQKIQALLRMAEHENSNPNEAALALERAQTLLLQHNLSRADVMTDTGKVEPAGIGKVEATETAGFTWKVRLLNVIAKSNLCSVVMTRSLNKWHLFGTQQNVRSVIAMYEWVSAQLETMAVKDWAVYHDKGGYEHVRTWKAGFFEGANSAIASRLEKPFETFRQGTGRELVVKSQADLQAATKRVFPHLRHTYSTSSRSSDGRASGREAGSKVSFARQSTINGGSLRLGAG